MFSWPNTYLLLTEFDGRTVNYGSRFSRLGHKSKGKKQGSVIYGADREKRLVRYLLYLFILK